MVVTEKQKNIILKCVVPIIANKAGEDPAHGTAIWFESKTGKTGLLTNAHALFQKESMTITARINNNKETRIEDVNILLESPCVMDEENDLMLVDVSHLIKTLRSEGKEIDGYFLNENMINTNYSGIPFLQTVLMVGFPGRTMEQRNCFPICRTGVIASDYSYINTPSDLFYLDIHSFGGASGSPIFLVSGEEIRLIGINKAGVLLSKKISTPFEDVSALFFNENIGVATCINSIAVRNLVQKFL